MIILIYIVLGLVILFFVNKFLSRFKFPKLTSLAVFTGAIKSGKSAVSLACALSVYRRILKGWKLRCFFVKFFNIFRKKKKILLPEKPLLYSNIELAKTEYCKLTLDHILRKKRFNFGSVVFVDESSLLADSQLIRNQDINTQLLLFFKLFGHSTHNGKMIVNSQQVEDNHYSLRRCTSQNFEIHHLVKWIPFFMIAYIREERYSESGNVINTYAEDVEVTLKRVIFRKSVFKKYDFCTFSCFTDNLPTNNIPCYNPKKEDLKTKELVSFRPEFQELSYFYNLHDKNRLQNQNNDN